MKTSKGLKSRMLHIYPFYILGSLPINTRSIPAGCHAPRNLVISIYWADRQTRIHPVDPGYTLTFAHGIDCKAEGKCTEVRTQHSPCFSSWARSKVKPWGGESSGFRETNNTDTFQRPPILLPGRSLYVVCLYVGKASIEKRTERRAWPSLYAEVNGDLISR